MQPCADFPSVIPARHDPSKHPRRSRMSTKIELTFLVADDHPLSVSYTHLTLPTTPYV